MLSILKMGVSLSVVGQSRSEEEKGLKSANSPVVPRWFLESTGLRVHIHSQDDRDLLFG